MKIIQYIQDILFCFFNKIPKYYNNIWWNRTCHMSDVIYPVIFDKNKKYIVIFFYLGNKLDTQTNF